jgi:phosphate transport system substrate-binding protein
MMITLLAVTAMMIRIDGSSTVFPIAEAVAEEFQKNNRDVRVTVGISGTGGGMKKLCNGELDVADASRPIKESEVAACGKSKIDYIELPVAFDGIAVVVNPRNTWATSMTTAELKKIWEPEAQKRITRWSQVRPGWPDKPIRLFGPGVDSGTYDYFTQAIVGIEHSSRGDYTSSEDDNVLVQGVASDPYALGFFGYAYYHENRKRLKAVAIDDGNPANGTAAVLPSVDSIRTAAYQPLSRPLFVYVGSGAAERPEVQRFVKYMLTEGPALTEEVGFVALPRKAYALATERFAARITGSLYGGRGSVVGSSIEKLLKDSALQVAKRAKGKSR